MPKSIIWYILKKNECSGQLSNTKKPGKAGMGAKKDDHNTLFFGYRFKISCKLNVCDQTGVRGCHKEVGILFSESTIKRHT